LGELIGYDVRSVRDFTDALVDAALLHVRRERQADGCERIYYAPGSALLAAAHDFHRRFPDGYAESPRAAPRAPAVHAEARTRDFAQDVFAAQDDLAEAPARPVQRERHVAPPTRAHPPETASGRPPEAISGELSDLEDHRELSSCANQPAWNTANEEEAGKHSTVDREVARTALAEHRRRCFPGRRADLFDADDLRLVAACSATIDGEYDAKLRAQLDALDAAFALSNGPPAVRYIWQKLDHFLRHEERDRQHRREGERARERATKREIEERRRDREWREQRRCAPPPEVAALLRRLARDRSDPAGRPPEAEIAKSRGEQLARLVALRSEATGDAPNG
jgi:hypothetical protein